MTILYYSIFGFLGLFITAGLLVHFVPKTPKLPKEMSGLRDNEKDLKRKQKYMDDNY